MDAERPDGANPSIIGSLLAKMWAVMWSDNDHTTKYGVSARSAEGFMRYTDFRCGNCRATLIRLVPQLDGRTVALVLHGALSFNRFDDCTASCRGCGAVTTVTLPERVAVQLRYGRDSSGTT
jgi:hypothetical protein